ncbi:MAG: hypothetical protein V4508_04180 [Pseudomonadota bacterium]
MKIFLNASWRTFQLAAFSALAIVGAYFVMLPAMAEPLAAKARSSTRAPQALMLAMASAGTRLVAVGERGLAIYSDDHGTSWTQAEVPVAVTLTAVHFADAHHGIAAGHDGALLTSSDGGTRWQLRLDGNGVNALVQNDAQQAALGARAALAAATAGGKAQAKAALAAAERAVDDAREAAKFGPSRPLLAVWMRDAQTAFAAGAFGQLLRSRDGGASWQSLASRIANPDGLHYNAFGHGADGALLIAGEAGRVYRSLDAGDSWRTLDTGYQGQLYGVAGTPSGLLAYGFGGHLLRSRDGGASWSALPLLGSRALVGAGTAPDGALLLAARDGVIYRSNDGGQSFSSTTSARGRELSALALVGSKLYLAGMGGVQVVTQH